MIRPNSWCTCGHTAILHPDLGACDGDCGCEAFEHDPTETERRESRDEAEADARYGVE